MSILTQLCEELRNPLDSIHFEETEGFGEDFPESRAWSSQYARLFVVDATDADTDGVLQLMKRCDEVIARQLRQSLNRGIEMDAHLCMLIDPKRANTEEQKADGLSEAMHSRFISRKYFVAQDRQTTDIMSKLTLLWPKTPETDEIESHAPLAEGLIELRFDLLDNFSAGATIYPEGLSHDVDN